MRWSKTFAVVTPLAFLGVIAVMVLPRLFPSLPALRGGDAAALVGGVAVVVMMLVTLAAEGPRRMLDVCPEHVTDGFVFAFKAMGSVLPIAGFFFVGANETAAQILGVTDAIAERVRKTGNTTLRSIGLEMNNNGTLKLNTAALDKALELADLINANGPLAVQAILKTIRETEGMHENEAFKPDTANGIPVFLSQDAKEGPLAFKEKRAPKFQMR